MRRIPHRCSSLLNGDDDDDLSQAFARRAQEERETLQKGRTWIGATDTLAERLVAFFTGKRPSVWKQKLARTVVRSVGRSVEGSLVVAPSEAEAGTQPSEAQLAVDTGHPGHRRYRRYR